MAGAAGVRRLVVPGRFNGPPGSGNGGYVAGRLARAYEVMTYDGTTPGGEAQPRTPDGTTPGGEAPGGQRHQPRSQPANAAITVTLRQPPPLDVGLDLAVDETGRLAATLGGAVLATVESGRLTTDPLDPVPPAAAQDAQARYAGLRAHPFPGCFVCGPDRPAADGLRLRPGRLGEDPAGPVACTWTPDASLAEDSGEAVRPEFVWAALDCPGGWASDLEARPMVLGRITAAVDAVPAIGDVCVVVAKALRSEGRKTFTASTAYDPDGRVLGRAEATWIALS